MAIFILRFSWFGMLFITASSLLYISEYETVTLECNISLNSTIWRGPPKSTIYAVGKRINTKLAKSDRLSTDYVKNQTQLNLQITNFTKDDAGMYSCSGTSVDNMFSEQTFNLKVRRPPSNLTIVGETRDGFVYGNVNRSLKLTCEVISGVPEEKIFWKAGNTIVLNGGPTRLTYTFVPKAIDHLQNVTCEAGYNETEIDLKHTVQLYLEAFPTIQIISTLDNTKNVENSVINILEGHNLTLDCKYRPQSRILSAYWKRDNVVPNIRHAEHLQFTNIRRDQAGLYECILENMVAAVYANETIDIVVQHAPTITINSIGREIKCIPDGEPKKYTFKDWEHKTEYDDHIRFLPANENGSLILPNVDGETGRHHDRGKYVCSVSNNISYNRNLFVTKEYFYSYTGKPYFVTSNNSTQYGRLGHISEVILDFVSFDEGTTISISTNGNSSFNYDTRIGENIRLIDTVYGRNVSVRGSRLLLSIAVDNDVDFRTYFVTAKNSWGYSEYNITLVSAGLLNGTSDRYVAVFVIIILALVCFAVVYWNFKRGNLNKIKNISCFGLQSNENRDEVAEANDINEMQNNHAASTQRQNPDVPIYSSIERRQDLNINNCVSYSACNKKKPNPLGHRKEQNNVDVMQTLGSTKNTAKKANANDDQEKNLTYIEVCFEQHTKGRELVIHGNDQKSNYVDIDFSKKVSQPLDSDPEDNSDDDFASVDDVRKMKKIDRESKRKQKS